MVCRVGSGCARRVGRTLAGAGCVEVVTSRSSARPRSTRSAFLPTTRCAPPCGSPTRCRARGRLHDDPAGPAPCGGPQPGSGHRQVSLFETGTVAFPVDRAGASRRRLASERGTSSPSCSTRSPSSRCLAVVLAGRERRQAGWWGARRAAGWSTRSRSLRRLGAELGVEGQGLVRQPDALAPRPLRARLSVARTVIRHAGELHPRSASRSGCPRGRRRRVTPRRAAGTARDVAGAGLSTCARWPKDVALVVGGAVTAADVEAALRGAGRCWSRSGQLRRLHG